MEKKDIPSPLFGLPIVIDIGIVKTPTFPQDNMCLVKSNEINILSFDYLETPNTTYTGVYPATALTVKTIESFFIVMSDLIIISIIFILILFFKHVAGSLNIYQVLLFRALSMD